MKSSGILKAADLSELAGEARSHALELARRHGYTLQAVLGENARKGTGVYRVGQSGRSFVLKCTAPEAPREARNGLRTEIAFYTHHRSPVIPPLIEASEDMLVVAQVEGTPLRRLLAPGSLDDESLARVLTAVKHALDLLYADCRGGECDAPTTDLAYRHLRSLTRSGPRSSRRPAFPVRLAGRITEMRLGPRLGRILAAADGQFIAPAFAHGDLHYDNVLVDPRSSAVCFLDFEKTECTSPFDFDLLYLVTMIECALGVREGPVRRLRELFRQVLQPQAGAEISALFRAGIAVNPRFNG
jgi:Ser/Thr protein kinase RdoA (MazF antagonist)